MNTIAHDLFVESLELPRAEREAFLNHACGNDSELHLEVQRLLVDAARADSFFGDGEGATLGAEEFKETCAEKEGEMIGPYILRQQIGEGGFGTVWMAEQRVPISRMIALKVVKAGMDTRQVLARFEAERQALAMMDHPNIARVFDAGATDKGRPFFVMELVKGIPITDYCDEAALGTNERLALFSDVCAAINHAHQKGIIHRDIKPSNVMVTLHGDKPVVKVIDFGIAKATQGKLTDKTLFTRFEQFIGTPVYMSPEQASLSGLDIDTRSDIYALGILLYELLTGKPPFDAKSLLSAGYEEMRRIIREDEPPKPSSRLATVAGAERETLAKARHIEPDKLKHLIEPDLDWIVMKAIEKDRARRYETANGLAMDLRRFLTNEPVTACPPTAGYQLRKFARRNRAALRVAAAIAAVLVAATIVSTWQAFRATRAQRVAEAAQASEARQRELADVARANETSHRQQAEAAERVARQRSYASDMNVAKQALDASNLGRALDLLDRQRQPGQRELRGWEWRYLWQQTRSDALFTLCQKESEADKISASADGKWLAIGTAHETGLGIWDIQARKEVAQLAPDAAVHSVAFSPTESVLAFASSQSSAAGEAQGKLRLWNSATRQMLAEIPVDGLCVGLVFSRDGKSLVTSTKAGQLALWRIPGLTKLRSFPNTQAGFHFLGTSFAATSDLSLAAYADGDGRLHVVDLQNGHELWTAKAAQRLITALAFSPDGKTLASAAGFNESDIRLWEVATGKELEPLEGHQSWVGSMVFWPDGKKMASCSADQTIRIWDLDSRKCVDVLRGHQLEVWRLALLPEGKTLASGCKDGTVCLWDASVTHDRRGRLSWEKIAGWRFASDNRSLVTVDYDGLVTRRSGQDFQWKETLFNTEARQPDNSGDWINRFSRDGNYLAVGSTNGTVSVWDVSRGVLQVEFRPGSGKTLPVCFLTQGTRLICWSETGNRLTQWDLKANREIQTWPAPGKDSYAFGLSPDEKQVVAASFDREFTLRHLVERSTTNLPLRGLECWSFDFSPDGKHLAASSAMGVAHIWENGTWREEATLRGFLKSVNSAVFSPDSQRLATGGSIPTDAVKLWDVDSWQELMTLEATGAQYGVTMFSPDGNFIGTLSNDGFLNLWHAPSWEEISAAEAK